MMRCFFLAGCLLVILAISPIALEAECPDGKSNGAVSGGFYFIVGPGNVPVYPRGGGRHEHWHAGLDLNVEFCHVKIFFSPMLAGAATFDNPDSVHIPLRVDVQIHGRTYAEFFFSDAYSLNNLPISDPHARRPTSGVNSTWLGVRREFAFKSLGGAFFVRQAVRGDEPLFFPYFTKPYAKQALGAFLETREVKHWRFRAEPEIYLSDSLSRGRFVVSATANRRIMPHLDFQATARFYKNINADHVLRNPAQNPLFFRREVLIGVRIPFGK